MSQPLEELLVYLDNLAEKHDEYSIYTQLCEIPEQANSFKLKAEQLAFWFYNATADSDYYLRPLTGSDDIEVDIQNLINEEYLTEEVLVYWLKRASETNNAIMKARYYGLIYEFQQEVTNKGLPQDIRREYINSLIQIIKNQPYKHKTDTIKAAKRAYSVAITLKKEPKDIERIKEVIKEVIVLETDISQINRAGTWGFSFEVFVIGKSKWLTVDQKNKLITDFESNYYKSFEVDGPGTWERKAQLLAKYYQSVRKKNDVKRVLTAFAQAVEKDCEDRSEIYKQSWLITVCKLFTRFQLHDEAKEQSKKIAVCDPNKDMVTSTHKTEISSDEMNQWLNTLIADNLSQGIDNIATDFLIDKEMAEERLNNASEGSLIHLVSAIRIVDQTGRQRATLADIRTAEGHEDHIKKQAVQEISFKAPFLKLAIDHLIKKYDLNSDCLTNILCKSQLFSEKIKKTLGIGLRAFIKKDYITCISVLTPCIESAFRNAVKLKSGYPLTYKKERDGFNERTLGNLLDDKCFSEQKDTLIFYAKVVLVEPIGFNIRNDLSHGLYMDDDFNSDEASLLIHLLLCLLILKVDTKVQCNNQEASEL